jgi:excisionase family DNA binding protein
MEPKLLSTKQAAEVLGVDDSRVRQLILSGKLPSMQIGRAHLIKEADLSLVKTYGKAGRPKKETEEPQPTKARGKAAGSKKPASRRNAVKKG